MSKMEAHRTYIEDENGALTDQTLCIIHPASDESIKLVLKSDETSADGASNWVWVRFQNGDLCLAKFPQGDTYLECELDAQAPSNI